MLLTLGLRACVRLIRSPTWSLTEGLRLPQNGRPAGPAAGPGFCSPRGRHNSAIYSQATIATAIISAFTVIDAELQTPPVLVRGPDFQVQDLLY